MTGALQKTHISGGFDERNVAATSLTFRVSSREASPLRTTAENIDVAVPACSFILSESDSDHDVGGGNVEGSTPAVSSAVKEKCQRKQNERTVSSG